mgnify:CR=1 FL=1
MKKLITTAVALVLAINITSCGENKTAEQHLQSAAKYSADNNINSAIVELKNAVRLAPKSAEARFQLGKAYLQQGNYVNAEKELLRAAELGEDVIVDLVQVKVKLEKFDDIYEIERNSAELSDEQYVVILTYAGIAALRSGKEEKAQDYLEQAISISADNSYAKVASAYLLKSNQEFRKGLVTISKLLEDSPNLSEAVLLKGHLLFAIQEFELASETFAQYREQHPKDHSIRYFEINSLIRAELFEKAEQNVDKLLALYSKAALANQYKAQLLYQAKKYNQSKEFAELAIQYGGNDFAVAKMIAGVSAYHLNDMEQAYNHLISIEPMLPSSHPVQKILAVVKMKLGYLTDAALTLNQLDNLTTEDAVFLQLASSELMKAGDFNTAQTMIDQAQRVLPGNAKITAQKGFLLLSQKDLSGIKSLEKALELDPNLSDIDIPLALQYIANKEYQKAEAIAEKLATKGDEISAYLIRGGVLTDQKNNTKAKYMFEQALALDPKNITSLYNLGMITENEGDISSSVSYYQRTLQVQPGHTGAIQHLSLAQAEIGKVSDVIKFLTNLYSGNKDNRTLAFGLAQNLRLDRQIEKAIEILVSINPKNELPISYWMNLGDSYTQIKDYTSAKNSYLEGVKAFPDNYLILLRIIGLFEIEKNYPKALQAAKKAYKKYPNNTRLEMLLAHFEFLNNNFEDSEKYLLTLQRKNLNHPFTNAIAGKLALNKKDYDNAVEYFSMAYEQSPSDINVINLARALKFSNQQQQSERALESYLTKNSKNIRVRMLLAELYQDKDKQKKIEQYIEVSKTMQNNFVVLNNLAWNLFLLDEIEQALIDIEKAYALQPTNLAVLESYGVILIANNKVSEGVKILKEAIKNGSKDINAYLGLAEALIAQQNYKEAENILVRINSQNESDLKKIEQLLKQLK